MQKAEPLWCLALRTRDGRSMYNTVDIDLLYAITGHFHRDIHFVKFLRKTVNIIYKSCVLVRFVNIY